MRKIFYCLVLAFLSLSFMPLAVHAASGVAYARIVHGATGLGTVDVSIDGALFLHDFSFGVATPYAVVPAGSHLVTIKEIGTGVQKLSQVMTADENTVYTVAVAGTVKTGYHVYTFIDTNTLLAGKIKVRAYQLSYPQHVDVSVVQNTVHSLPFASASEYMSYTASHLSVDATFLSSHTLLHAAINVQPNHIVSIFLVGSAEKVKMPTDQPAQIVLQDVQGIPQVPNTGSDPNVLLAIPWPSIEAYLILAGIIVIVLLVKQKPSTTERTMH